jgi:ABC-type amino acid transport substrate-binding protein
MFHGFGYPDETGNSELVARFWRPVMRNGVIYFERPDKNADGILHKSLRPKTAKVFVKTNKIKSVEKEYDELELAIDDLAKGTLVAVVCDNPIAANYVLQNQKYKPILKMAGDIFTSEQYGIAVNKGNTEILELINNGIKKVQEKGIDKELEIKWLK